MTIEQIDDALFSIETVEEEPVSFLLLEDLIWEYNERIQKGRGFGSEKHPLSLRLPVFNGGETIISPMTEEEINEMNLKDQRENCWMKVLLSNFTPAGLVRNIPNIREGIRLKEVIRELGLQGKIVYRTVKDNIYVILKGNQKLREVLTGTRYRNSHPKIVKFGLSKVNFTTALKGTAITALIFYGCAKTVDGLSMYFEDGELRPGFFSEIPAEITKLTISSIAATAVGVGLVTFGAPIAVGIGLALVAGFAADIILEHFDKQTGFTKAVADATERLVSNVKNEWVVLKRNLSEVGRQSTLEVIKRIKDEQKALLERALKRGAEAVQEMFFDLLLSPKRLGLIIATGPGLIKNPLEGFKYDGQVGRTRNFAQNGKLFYITT
ncbi:MAG: hypothetical protein K940chlam7_00892 [Chlamydiae bacterium]|nr:hypothetical protein [Chlamydiota bacterium]